MRSFVSFTSQRLITRVTVAVTCGEETGFTLQPSYIQLTVRVTSVYLQTWPFSFQQQNQGPQGQGQRAGDWTGAGEELRRAVNTSPASSSPDMEEEEVSHHHHLHHHHASGFLGSHHHHNHHHHHQYSDSLLHLG